MGRVKCFSVDDDYNLYDVKCNGGGFVGCRGVEVKNGIFSIPYPYHKDLALRTYCDVIKKNTIWIEYDLEYVMKKIIKEHEEKK
jgi:hypothetical protein